MTNKEKAAVNGIGELEVKNTNAIDKIIAELCMKEYQKANPHPKMRKNGTTNYHPYSLTDEINEYRQIKADYKNDTITEEEYKAACLRYNLRAVYLRLYSY